MISAWGLILPSNQSRIIEWATFTYFPLVKHLKKQYKIEDQEEQQLKAVQEDGRQEVKSCSEKESLTLLKHKTNLVPKNVFEEVSYETMGCIQNLSKQIDFNDLIYYFQGKSGPKNFINFKGPLGFYENKKDGYITLEKAEENKNHQIGSKWKSKRDMGI